MAGTERPAAPEPAQDHAEAYWAEWTLNCAVRLQADYGHSWGTASGLAALARDTLRQSLEEPRPLCLITGF